MNSINTARLNKRVELQYIAVARNSYGGEDRTWTTEATIWADIQPALTFRREFFSNIQERAEVTHTITLRYRTGVRPTKRFKYGNRTFDIESVVDVDERNLKTVDIIEKILTGYRNWVF